jgi:hypothetical protein
LGAGLASVYKKYCVEIGAKVFDAMLDRVKERQGQ